MQWPVARRVSLALAVFLLGCPHRAELPRFEQFSSALALPSVGSVPYDGSALRGRVVLIDFFATWCFPCVGEIPLLQRLQASYSKKGFTIVGIGMDLEGAQVLEPFASEYHLSFPVVVADDKMRQGQSAFGSISTLPSAFLFGRDGRLIAAFEGLPAPAEIDQLVSKAIGE